jgi:hypothetical protein
LKIGVGNVKGQNLKSIINPLNVKGPLINIFNNSFVKYNMEQCHIIFRVGFYIFIFIFSSGLFAGDNVILLSAAGQKNNESNNYGWRSSAENTVSFSGDIVQNSFLGYQHVINGKVKNVIVNSGGGDVNEAIKIATDIYKRNLRVIIDGLCLSSCANYLLPAANAVKLSDGFIGVHGNVTSCVKLYGSALNFAKLGYGGRLSDHQLIGNVKNIYSTIKNENEFYKIIGLDPEYLYLTCRPDKGMFDGSTYAFFAPKVESLGNYGIKNFSGAQSYSMIRDFERIYNSRVLFR